MGGAPPASCGEEIDRIDYKLGSPRHALVLASSIEPNPLTLRTKEELQATMPPFEDPDVRADMVFFECAGGGAVFSAGSVSYASALAWVFLCYSIRCLRRKATRARW